MLRNKALKVFQSPGIGPDMRVSAITVSLRPGAPFSRMRAIFASRSMGLRNLGLDLISCAPRRKLHVRHIPASVESDCTHAPGQARSAGIVLAGTFLCGLVVTVSGHALADEPSCPAAAAEIVVLPATRLALSHHQPITIVALGSSSTQGSGATAPDRAYPARLEALLRAEWPDVTVVNKGIGGQTIDAVMGRLDTDVLALKPTLVIWQAGTNEALRAMDPERFATLLDEGVRRIVATGADVILMDTQIAPRVPADRQQVYDAVLAKEAEQRQVSLFSRARLMREWLAYDPPVSGMIGPDGLHHTDRGYACVAASLGEAIANAVGKGVPVAIVSKKPTG